MSGPLAGIRIVDVTTVLTGPFATRIKAEAPWGDNVHAIGAARHEGYAPHHQQKRRQPWLP
jgi:crotonobetainyl-CoA:carnitine CoA-transferase CaiB-like acyl-CoA transferase